MSGRNKRWYSDKSTQDVIGQDPLQDKADFLEGREGDGRDQVNGGKESVGVDD